MKMLFFSSDNLEVERVHKEFVAAGIACEVRNGHPRASAHTELWIRNDRDCHRAFMLCVHLGLGFSKRTSKAVAFDSSELEPATDQRH
jgi:hypothetical protein